VLPLFKAAFFNLLSSEHALHSSAVIRLPILLEHVLRGSLVHNLIHVSGFLLLHYCRVALCLHGGGHVRGRRLTFDHDGGRTIYHYCHSLA